MNDQLLYQIHTLLARNHYQSSVKDLQHLLDGQSLQVWIQEIDQLVVAALVLEFEGPIDPSLHSAIVNGKRRLQHQLLPQLLAYRSSKEAVLGKRFARIVRIAVASEFRRQSLASTMLTQVEQYLSIGNSAIQAMGASFANDASSVAFWKHNGYVQFHHGARVNPRTGTVSIAVIKSNDSVINEAASLLSSQS